MPTQDPNAPATVPELISTCRRHAKCDDVLECETGPTSPVCVDSVGYKNRGCALCNYESAGFIYDGFCTAPPSDNDFISACPSNATAAQAKACATSSANLVCAGNKNYKNYACALCNGVGQNGLTYSPCSATISASGVQVYDACPRGATLPASAFVDDCQNGDAYVVCATPGPRDQTPFTAPTNFKNAACARCNGLNNISFDSFCELQRQQPEDGRVIIETCSSDPDIRDLDAFTRQCQQAEPFTVCVRGQNYRNSNCAYCNIKDLVC